ncbi:hypothetical protein [Candidatus Mycoplasma haematominutum]|uniref:hypothetical protein n=1 Tax=Candidatus Mycoplasma haematominutum TaxID=209446 RepID=UPI0016512D7A|nr:hypothetical protein [Candidatus Mycoplasma haematominutum]
MIGATGVSSAVGVPIVLNSSGATGPVDTLPGGREVIQVSMNKCESTGSHNNLKINFGDEEIRDVCWNISEDKKIGEHESELTSLFKSQWGDSNQNWNSNLNQGKWTQQCLDSETQSTWAVFGNTGSRDYLGLCNTTEVNQTPFVKKVKTWNQTANKDIWTISMCVQDCFETDAGSIGNSPVALQTEKTENWSEVAFNRKTR